MVEAKDEVRKGGKSEEDNLFEKSQLLRGNVSS